MTDDYFLSSLLPLVAVLMVLLLTSMISPAQASPVADQQTSPPMTDACKIISTGTDNPAVERID